MFSFTTTGRERVYAPIPRFITNPFPIAVTLPFPIPPHFIICVFLALLATGFGLVFLVINNNLTNLSDETRPATGGYQGAVIPSRSGELIPTLAKTMIDGRSSAMIRTQAMIIRRTDGMIPTLAKTMIDGRSSAMIRTQAMIIRRTDGMIPTLAKTMIDGRSSAMIRTQAMIIRRTDGMIPTLAKTMIDGRSPSGEMI